MAILLNEEATDFSDKNLSVSVLLDAYTSEREYIVGVRVDLGGASGPLDEAKSDITIKAKITNLSEEVIEAYSRTVTKEAGLTQLIHNFDKTLYVRSGEVLAIWAKSDNANDVSISGGIYVLAVRAAGGTALISMERDDIESWLEAEFAPLELVTPSATIQQLIQNAIRYWNTHSGHKISRVYEYLSADKRVRLDTDFKSVVQVLPTITTTWIWNDHPLWTLLGITVLDNVTTDLILMGEAFRNYRTYVGTNFMWQFERSPDPSEGGYLYAMNLPSGTQALFVVGTKRITETENIQDEYILDWVLNYSKALLKIVEGNSLRKADIAGIKNDGQELVNEGNDEKKELKESLARDARWVALAKRA